MKYQSHLGSGQSAAVSFRRSLCRGLPRRNRRGGGGLTGVDVPRMEPLEGRLLLSADSIVTFNEIHYHPSSAGTTPEWIELRNQNAVNVDMSGWRIGGGIDFSFPNGTVIPGGGFIVVSASPSALEAATGFVGAMGPYTGALSNAGEELILYNNSDRLMDWIDYGDNDPWPVAPDGSGATLAKIHPNMASGEAGNWTWSVQIDGTPGADNFAAPDLTPVTTPVIHFDGEWNYDDSGTDLGTTWSGPGYDDSAWQSGQGLFFAGDAMIGQASDLLVGYWPLDDDFEDLSQYGNHGTLLGGTLSADVPSAIGGGKSLSLSAGEGGVNVAGNISLNLTTFTVSYWLKNPGQTTGTGVSNGATGHNRVFSRGADSFETAVNNVAANGGSNRVKFHASGWRDTPYLTPLDTWVHMAWVYDGSLLTLYANGSAVHSEPRGISQLGDLRIGSRVGGIGGENFVGGLDDVAVWKVALDAASVQSLANGTTTPFALVPPEPPVTTQITVLSNTSTWRQSTTVVDGGAAGTWTPSAAAPPAAGTYTIVPTSTAAAGVLPHITTAAGTLGATGLVGAPNVVYFRSTFDLPEFTSVTANIQLAVDNGAQVFINGVEIGREVSYLTENWATPMPSLNIASNGTVTRNKFDASAATFTGWVEGTNEIVLAVRNPNSEAAPAGGFAFRMDLSVVSPAEPAPIADGGEGSADGELTTELTLGSPTYYFRKSFTFNDDPDRTTLRLVPIVDDGAIFYLNGVEVYRQNMPGGAATFNTLAATEIDDAVFEDGVLIDGSLLVPGTNVLAVEVHQASPGSTDMMFGASLTKTVTPTPPDELDRLRINEIDAGGSGSFFVEIRNEGSTAVDLAGYVLATETGQEYVLPAQMLASGALASFTAAQIGFTPASTDQLFLYGPGRTAVADGVAVDDRLIGRSDLHEGRWMYPSAATPGAANTFDFANYIVINEIMYHHRHRDPSPQEVISTVLLPIDSTWRYNQTGTGLAAGWQTTTHPVDNVTWFSGQALLGFDTTPGAIPEPILTPLTVGPTKITFYFEREFELTADQAAGVVQMRHIADDGMIVYVNGVFAHAFNMSHPTTPTTLAPSAVDNAAYVGPITIPANLLQVGTNRISVEVHQNTTGSSDVMFGLELSTAEIIVEGNPFEEVDDEWVELYNRSAGPIDLSGWSFDDAIDFTFPAGTILGAGQYLVVSNDAAALAMVHPGITILGNFDRGLSNSTDRIQLRDAFGNIADEVRYYDGGRWDEFADGGGSSLELRDPFADNGKPEAWAASDESGDSPWQTITYRGRATNNTGPTTFNEFVMGLLDSGVILIDDITVVEDPDGVNRQVIQNGTFESGSASTWRIIGNHHGQVIDDPDMPGNKVLELTANGATEHIHNHAETTLKDGANFITINSGLDYEISFRAKWITGSNQINTRLYFDRLQRTTLLTVPQVNGTPGEANSIAEPNIGPTYDNLTHSPTIPLPTEAVLVSVAASDAQGVASMQLFYSVNGSAFSGVPMALGGDGRYEGLIPAQAGGAIVQFYVQGVDSLGAASAFPAAGPNSRALYQVEDGRHSPDAKRSFRIIMTPADTTLLHTQTNVMSNDHLGATVIYNEGQVFYDVGVHLKGSERGRNQDIRAGFIVKFNPDQLFRGAHQSIAVDRSGAGNEYSQKEILVKHIASSAGNMPHQYDDLIYLATPRTQLTGSAMLSMARYNDVFLDSYFDNGSDGTAWEYELIYFPTTTTGGVEGLKLPYPNPDGVVGVNIRYRGENTELYRWTFLIKNNRAEDDYSPLIRLAQTLGMSGQALYDAADANIDVDLWLRGNALLALTGIGDSYGSGAQHNLMLYERPEDGRIILLPHDTDFAFSNSATGGVVNNTDLSNLIGRPSNQRLYYGHLHDFINTSFNSAYMAPWVAHYDSLLPAESLAGFTSYIGTRSTHVLNLINATIPQVDFAITTNGGNDVTVDTTTTTIQGMGWVNVREIRTGTGEVLPVEWITNNTWRVTVPLLFGENELAFVAYDFQGNAIAADDITVTSTVTDRPQYDLLRISEVHYHPADPTTAEMTAGFTNADQFEFLEIRNISDTITVDLTGAKFTNGINFDFTDSDVTSLGPGQYVVIVSNGDAFNFRYSGASVMVAGQYTGSLNNAGETLRFEDAEGRVIHEFRYEDGDDPMTEADWPALADGDGPSLDLIDLDADRSTWQIGTSWRLSGIDGGTPGRPDPVVAALPGDTNYNNTVDIGDLSRLAVNFGLDGSMNPAIDVRWQHGDFNGDRRVNITDLSILASRFGQSVMPGAAASLDDQADLLAESPSRTARQSVAVNPASRIGAPSASGGQATWNHIADLLGDAQ